MISCAGCCLHADSLERVPEDGGSGGLEFGALAWRRGFHMCLTVHRCRLAHGPTAERRRGARLLAHGGAAAAQEMQRPAPFALRHCVVLNDFLGRCALHTKHSRSAIHRQSRALHTKQFKLRCFSSAGATRQMRHGQVKLGR